MATRKAGRKDPGGRFDRWTWSVEDHLEHGRNHCPDRYRKQEEYGDPAMADEQEKNGNRDNDEGEDCEAAESGHVADGFFDPQRSERVAGVARLAEEQSHGLVEAEGLALKNLIGEEPKAEQQNRNGNYTKQEGAKNSHLLHPEVRMPHDWQFLVVAGVLLAEAITILWPVLV